jgi:hypothetical protein
MFLSSVKDDLSLRVLLIVAFWLDLEEDQQNFETCDVNCGGVLIAYDFVQSGFA